MSLNDILSLFAAMITVGLVTVILRSPNTAAIIKAWGEAFSSSLRTAMGD